MQKKELIELGLTEELADKVAKASAEEFKDYVSKERFNEVNDNVKELKSQITDRDKQLTDLKKTAGDSKELQDKITELQTANKTASANYEQKISDILKNNAIDNALMTNKAKNIKAVRGLLDMDKIKVDGETVTGIDEQIKSLIKDETSSFLFEKEEKTPPVVKGVTPANGNKQPDAGLSLGAQFAQNYCSQFDATPNTKGV